MIRQIKIKITRIFVMMIFVFCFAISLTLAEDKPKNKGSIEEPITVNGDTVEYSQDSKEVTASGNVKVMYKGTTLSCDKLSVNTQNKEGKAEGNVKLEDLTGTMEGKEVKYDFQNKSGTIYDANFRYPPYFGHAKKLERVSENEFLTTNGYVTTCNLDHPHYRLASKSIRFFPKDKIQAAGNAFFLGNIPVMYLPKFNRSFKDPLYHVQLTPGTNGTWGPYMLSAWRYDLTDHIKGRIYLDYRLKLGVAEGFGANYTTENFGKGDFKYYYTQERPVDLRKKSIIGYKDTPYEFQRYLIRLRHNWDVDLRTKLTAELYKIEDSKRQMGKQDNFLKDYFFREFEKDAQPKSYALLNHNFDYSSLSLLMQKRVNRWYAHAGGEPDDKLPEVTYTLPEYKLGASPFYFRNNSVFSNIANRYPSPTEQREELVRFDTYNQLSLPFRAAIFSVTPYAGARETVFSRDKTGDKLNPRTIHYSGVDTSTKFYRTYDYSSNFLGMEINKIRHIVTPITKYAYIHRPTISSNKLQIFDSLDSIYQSNKITLELVNKLQTKRSTKKGEIAQSTVDFVTFDVSSDYNYKQVNDTATPQGFYDFLFDLELIPYSWLRVESDATYSHANGYFKNANVDLFADFNKDTSFGIGHRYERKGGKELTAQFNCRLSPKWKLKVYERYQFSSQLKKGFREQEYTLSRDLHCWEMDLSFNVDREKGQSIWLVFRLKAFPESEIKFDQTYHAPKRTEPQAVP